MQTKNQTVQTTNNNNYTHNSIHNFQSLCFVPSPARLKGNDLEDDFYCTDRFKTNANDLRTLSYILIYSMCIFKFFDYNYVYCIRKLNSLKNLPRTPFLFNYLLITSETDNLQQSRIEGTSCHITLKCYQFFLRMPQRPFASCRGGS